MAFNTTATWTKKPTLEVAEDGVECALSTAMVSLLSIVLFGFLLGMRHATDPDHVVAVTTIVSREKSLRAAAAIGSVWGLGHTATIFLLGGAIVVFDVVIPPRVGLALELAVAVMLIGLGVWTLLRKTKVEASPGDSRLRAVRPLVAGTIHGLAGSAAIALLLVPTIRNPLWAAGYLLVFGAGTIVGMLLISAAIAMPFAYTARRFDRVNRTLVLVSAIASVALGAFLVHKIGFSDGLFGPRPTWTPQ